MQSFGTYTITEFGALPGGTIVQKITMAAPSGLTLEVLTLGATIHRLWVPAKNGAVDVVLGKADLAGYLAMGLCNSSIIGRFANRVSGASYTYKGRCVPLQANFGQHCIHGGSGCYAGKNFTFAVQREAGALRLQLRLLDRGQGGFPGYAAFGIDYVLENQCVRLEYQAVPTEDTPWNVTSHAYFDLNGHGSGAAAGQLLQLNADAYLPAAADGVPTGEVRCVENTDFDFRIPRLLSDALQGNDPQLTQFGGFDHNFCLSGSGMRQAAELRGLESGICMQVWTDLPGLQLFTLNAVPQGFAGKDGRIYNRHASVCLETQHYPDAVHHPEWPSPMIPAGVCSRTSTAFVFC